MPFSIFFWGLVGHINCVRVKSKTHRLNYLYSWDYANLLPHKFNLALNMGRAFSFKTIFLVKSKKKKKKWKKREINLGLKIQSVKSNVWLGREFLILENKE